MCRSDCFVSILCRVLDSGELAWHTIVGVDDMGTDNWGRDDQAILMDPFDVLDHYQDGYDTFPAKRFFSLWHEGKGSGEDGKAFVQPYVIIENKAPTK